MSDTLKIYTNDKKRLIDEKPIKWKNKFFINSDGDIIDADSGTVVGHMKIVEVEDE